MAENLFHLFSSTLSPYCPKLGCAIASLATAQGVNCRCNLSISKLKMQEWRVPSTRIPGRNRAVPDRAGTPGAPAETPRGGESPATRGAATPGLGTPQPAAQSLRHLRLLLHPRPPRPPPLETRW